MRRRPRYSNPVECWDRHARKRKDKGECGSLHATMAEWLSRYIGEGDTILEVGAGDGRIYSFLDSIDRGWSDCYRGCDISREYIELCKEREGICVDWWDGRTLPYGGGSFDWVISFSVLLHVPPVDIERHVAELQYVARRYLFISTYTGSADGLAAHCFRYDYDTLFSGMRVVERREFMGVSNSQWLLEA